MANKSLSKKVITAVILSATMAVSAFSASALDETTEINANNNIISEENEIISTDNEEAVTTTAPKAFNVTINCDGEKHSVTMNQGTVSDALKKARITLRKSAKVKPSLNTELTDSTKITVDDSVKVGITLRGVKDTYTVPNGNVSEALESLGVDVDKYDKVSPQKSTVLKEGMNIKYTDVSVKKVTKTKKVKFKTKKVYSNKLNKGKKQIKTKGVNGKQKIVIEKTYHDGSFVSKKVVSKKLVKKPVKQVVVIGTKEPIPKNSFVDNTGKRVVYARKLTGSGTAYTAPAGSGTATGARVAVGRVAVNPYIIPYGSKLYIEAVDGSYVYGYATAVDTGGALMSGAAIVDLFMNTYSDCCVFGRRNVNVYVLK